MFSSRASDSAVARSAEVVFVAPARLGDELRAVARERARYGRSGIYDVTVHRADGTLVAEFRGQSHQPSAPVDAGGGDG